MGCADKRIIIIITIIIIKIQQGREERKREGKKKKTIHRPRRKRCFPDGARGFGCVEQSHHGGHLSASRLRSKGGWSRKRSHSGPPPETAGAPETAKCPHFDRPFDPFAPIPFLEEAFISATSFVSNCQHSNTVTIAVAQREGLARRGGLLLWVRGRGALQGARKMKGSKSQALATIEWEMYPIIGVVKRKKKRRN